MTRPVRSTSAFLPLLAATLLALFCLGTLQYYWVAQVSAGDRERRQASVSLAAARLGEDFDRELARAYLALQMDAATLRDQAWDRYAQRIDRWQATAPYPGLVRDVYLIQVNQLGRIGLSRYSPSSSSFEQLVWPFELLPVRRQIERAYRAIWSQGESAVINLPAVSNNGPALLIPIARPWLLSAQQDAGIGADMIFSDMVIPGAITRCVRCPPELYDTPLLAHTLVVLDREFIAGTFLPTLIERTFAGGNDLEYHIGVVDRNQPQNLIYSSDSRQTAENYTSGDVAVDIFGITYDELNALILTSAPSGDGGPTDQRGRVVIGVLGRQGEAPAGAGGSGAWRLVVKHRQGSLDAAVAGLRTRNLLISFGTLLLLGVSMALLMASTRRAQRLAQQQIDFASAVSHELRTPLAVIRSAGENLADGLVNDLPRARQYGAVIANEGRRLTEMVEQVLAFAGAHSGKERYHFQLTDATALIEGVIQNLEPHLRAGGYTLERALAPELPMLYADPVALRRSLQNLIANAMKYGAEKAWIGVEARVDPEVGELLITVSDHGPGIEPSDLPHIFEPFYRGRPLGQTPPHGSGLGLSLVRHAVKAHGGRVSVESKPGQGARFSIHLPLDPQRASAAALVEAA